MTAMWPVCQGASMSDLTVWYDGVEYEAPPNVHCEDELMEQLVRHGGGFERAKECAYVIVRRGEADDWLFIAKPGKHTEPELKRLGFTRRR